MHFDMILYDTFTDCEFKHFYAKRCIVDTEGRGYQLISNAIHMIEVYAENNSILEWFCPMEML